MVTPSGEFEGGVLVDERGIIEAVLKKESGKALLAESYDNFLVSK